MKKNINVIIMAMLVSGVIFSVWLFVKNTQTVELTEGQSFKFKNYIIRVESLGGRESGPMIRVYDEDAKKIEHLYFSEEDGLTQEGLGLIIETNKENDSRNVISLKLIKQ